MIQRELMCCVLQPGSVEAANVCEQLVKLATGEQEHEQGSSDDTSDNRKTHFTVVTKVSPPQSERYDVDGGASKQPTSLTLVVV